MSIMKKEIVLTAFDLVSPIGVGTEEFWESLTAGKSGVDFAIAGGGTSILGIALDLNFLLLRVDLGMKLHDPARSGAYKWVGPRQWFSRDSYAVHFGVGYPF